MQPKIKTPFPTLAPKGKITKKRRKMCVVWKDYQKKKKTKQKDENEGERMW
jgi:hypothetical protein